MKNNHINKKRWGLTLSLVFFVFAVMMGAFLIVGILSVVLHVTGAVSFLGVESGGRSAFGPFISLFSLIGLCVLLGTALTAFLSKKALNPILKVIDAIHKVASGDFSVKVELKGIGELEELSQSFNKMTHELSSLETLRSDFVNNFSHEFKTPIVSVRGFAKLLKEGNLLQWVQW